MLAKFTTATETEQAEEIQKLQSDRLKMQEEVDRLKKEVNKLKYTLEKEPQFNIDKFKDNCLLYWFPKLGHNDSVLMC